MISYSIPHVETDPQRRSWLIDIRRSVPHARVIREMGRGAWDTALRAWLSYDREASHHAIIQDDMLPCPNFRDLLQGAADARPEAIICFFSMRRVLLEAKEKGLSWIEAPDGVWGGAVMMPSPWIGEWLAWGQRNIRKAYPHDDRRLGLWAEETERPVFITAPSLVQHLGAAQSLVGHSNPRRVTPWWSNGSPVDWDTEAIRTHGRLDRMERERMLR